MIHFPSTAKDRKNKIQWKNNIHILDTKILFHKRKTSSLWYVVTPLSIHLVILILPQLSDGFTWNFTIWIYYNVCKCKIINIWCLQVQSPRGIVCIWCLQVQSPRGFACIWCLQVQSSRGVVCIWCLQVQSSRGVVCIWYLDLR